MPTQGRNHATSPDVDVAAAAADYDDGGDDGAVVYPVHCCQSVGAMTGDVDAGPGSSCR